MNKYKRILAIGAFILRRVCRVGTFNCYAVIILEDL